MMQASSELRQRIVEDFSEWSGGFPPESPEQIAIYVEDSRPGDTDPEQVRQILVEWMNSDEEG